MKTLILRFCRGLGLFRISAWIYRHRLPILCFHGFSFDDEHLFRPSLFMTPRTLQNRLDWMSSEGFNVLGLSDAVRKLRDGSLPQKSVVITIDDGFRSVGALAAPLLRKHDMPATLYVTSYYSNKGTPIFRLALQYMCWKSALGVSALTPLIENLPIDVSINEGKPDDPLWQLIDHGERYLNEAERVALLTKAAELLDVDYRNIEQRGQVSLHSAEEIRELAATGIDIQLHTHRHTLPEDEEGAVREIQDNREYLEPLVSKRLRHFCYPSGIWRESNLPILKSLGIETATTCDPGLNDRETNPLALRRFLDREDVAQVEFEAELLGFKELIRSLRARLLRKQEVGEVLPSTPPPFDR